MTDLPTALREWRGAHPARVAAEALGIKHPTYLNWEAGRAPLEPMEALLRRAIMTPIDAMIEKTKGGA